MQKEEKIDNRLSALDQLLTEKQKSRRWLGLAIKRGPNAVQKWFERNYWPDREESRMEEELGVQPGFFARIHAGQDYAAALQNTLTESDISQAVNHVDYLLRADPSGNFGPFKVKEIQMHLSRQIDLFYQAAVRHSKVTKEQLIHFRELARTKTRPLSKSSNDDDLDH